MCPVQNVTYVSERSNHLATTHQKVGQFLAGWLGNLLSNLPIMQWTITKTDVALDQLDWSIRLLIDYKSYPSSITLAGAAEEVLGKNLSEESAIDILKPHIDVVFDPLFEKEDRDKLLNKTKNAFKHWSFTEDALEIDIESETLQYIFRAMYNLFVYNHSISSETPRFLKWLKTNRPELWRDDFDKMLAFK
ncbi:MAG: hypothetical protein WC521_02890 [Bdellovibrionales bacterium]